MSTYSATREDDAYEEHERFMRMAIGFAEKAALAGDVPVGAVIVRDGEFVAGACNRIEAECDPTMHAEIAAIREAARVLSTPRLADCSMYVTVEPCSMCAGACVLARLDAVYAGAPSPKSGAAGSVKDILTGDGLNHRVSYVQGILSDECAALMSAFFAELRIQKTEADAQR